MSDLGNDAVGGRIGLARTAMAVGVVVGLASLPSWVSTDGASPLDERDGSTVVAEPATPEPLEDPRVTAFVDAYDALIDSVTRSDDDILFHLGRRPIHFQDGRMLSAAKLERSSECDPIFYRYPLEPLREVPPPPESDERPTYCSDLLESLWGRTESEIRGHGQSVTFLGHRMFVNRLVGDALRRAEPDIRSAARSDPEVRRWLDELDITYSFIDRGIAGSDNRSQHAFGMAVDFVPSSYRGRAVYWRWSRALDRQGWFGIPLERRWRPPSAVVRIFERHGFVWGGKWTHFDMIHFEYRPEIIEYSRLVDGAS